jgi:hypothetical protein
VNERQADADEQIDVIADAIASSIYFRSEMAGQREARQLAEDIFMALDQSRSRSETELVPGPR